MKLAVIGSRTFTSYDMLRDELNEIDDITEIVSGGAGGADTLAVVWATRHQTTSTIFFPDWDQFGKSAGPLRNTQIVDYCDKLIAFWDGKSRGTKDSITKAKAQGKLLKIVYFTKFGEDPDW